MPLHGLSHLSGLQVKAVPRTRTKAESNHNRAVVATSVSSWFESFKEVLDIMPDEGWYLVPHARRRYVYDQYMSEARASPNLRGCLSCTTAHL